MNILRDERQLALQEVLVACEESADHLRDAAQFIESQEISARLSELAAERDLHVTSLGDLLRDVGDLPTLPDRDRETVEELLNRAFAKTSAEPAAVEFLRQRVAAEDQLAQLLLEKRQLNDLKESDQALLKAVAQHSGKARANLTEMLGQLGN